MKKNKFSQDLLILAILTTITVFTWIGFEVYHTLAKSQIPQVLEEQMSPLDPKLEAKVIESLSSKVLFQKEEISATQSGEVEQ